MPRSVTLIDTGHDSFCPTSAPPSHQDTADRKKVILAPEQIPQETLSGWGDPPRSKPLVGKQLFERLAGMGADAFEDVAQIGERIDAESFARGDESWSGPPLSVHRCVAPIEHPVSATNRDSTQAAFGTLLSISKSPSSQYRVNAFQFDNA